MRRRLRGWAARLVGVVVGLLRRLVERGGPMGLVASDEVLGTSSVAVLDIFDVGDIGLESDVVDGVLGHC